MIPQEKLEALAKAAYEAAIAVWLRGKIGYGPWMWEEMAGTDRQAWMAAALAVVAAQ